MVGSGYEKVGEIGGRWGKVGAYLIIVSYISYDVGVKFFK